MKRVYNINFPKEKIIIADKSEAVKIEFIVTLKRGLFFYKRPIVEDLFVFLTQICNNLGECSCFTGFGGNSCELGLL